MWFFKNIVGSLWIVLLLPSEIKGQCTKPTTSDGAVLHSDDILKNTFEEDTSVRLRCHPGYEPSSGKSKITCSSGQWTPSPESFICRKKSCGNPGEVTNGDYKTPNGIEFGAVIEAVCNTGFYLLGEKQRSCLASGEWDGREAVCEPVTCAPPPPVTNGHLTVPSEEYYKYAEVVHYACNADYNIIGGNAVHCLVHGNWSEIPRCTKVNCPRPDIPNAKRIVGPSGPYTLGIRLIYECVKGYRMTTPDNNQMVCREEGWSHNLTCEEVKCTQPHVTNATITEGAGGSYGYDAVVRYNCPAEQKLVGSPQLKCESNGQWSSNPPVCLKEDRDSNQTTIIIIIIVVLLVVIVCLVWILIRNKKKKKNRLSTTPSPSENAELKSLSAPENGV